MLTRSLWKNWCGSRELRPDFLRGGDALCLNHNREIKRAGNVKLPAHAISTKNKHLLAIYSIPARGFTAAVSVFRGTPPIKPLICKFKIRFNGVSFWSWADPTGEASLLVLAKFNLSPEDIIKMSFSSFSRLVYLSSLFVRLHALAGKTKTLPTRGKQGERKSISLLYLPTPSLSKLPSGCCPIGARDSPRLNAQPWSCRV